MGTISAKRIDKQLEQAKRVGRVEEPFTVMGCNLVLQNLLPSDYESINEETKELEDLSYVNAFRLGHVSRSIIEINGVDLRDVDYVEIEVPDPRKGDGTTKAMKVERYTYIRDFVLNSWAKEAIDVTFHKFADVVTLAEKASADGVKFITADEESDEKFRRLLGEAKEAEADVAQELAERILGEHGYMHKTTVSEMAKVDEVLKRVAEETRVAFPPPPPPPPPVMHEEVPEEPRPEPKPVRATPENLERVMRGRVPMNMQPNIQQQAIPLPAPVETRPESSPVGPTGPVARRAAIAALEGEVDPGIVPTGRPTQVNLPPDVPVFRQHSEAVTLEKKPQQAGHVAIDQPPTAGLNPRYKSHKL